MLLLRFGPRHGRYFGAGRVFRQVYSTLARMVRDELIRVLGEEAGRGPDRNKYEITAAGQDRVREWLFTPDLPSESLQSELLAKTVIALLLIDDADLHGLTSPVRIRLVHTLLHSLAGVLVPDGGSVTYRPAGRPATEVNALGEPKRYRLRLTDFGFIFLFGQLPGELSGGQAQRLAVPGALVTFPAVQPPPAAGCPCESRLAQAGSYRQSVCLRQDH